MTIKTKPASDEYRNNWEAIFGTRKPLEQKSLETCLAEIREIANAKGALGEEPKYSGIAFGPLTKALIKEGEAALKTKKPPPASRNFCWTESKDQGKVMCRTCGQKKHRDEFDVLAGGLRMSNKCRSCVQSLLQKRL